MTNEKMKRYVGILGQRERLGFMYDANNEVINLGSLPKTMDEAKSYSNFWQSFLGKFAESVEEITFNYQEKSKQIPLTKFQKFKNYFGAQIKPQEIEGEVKECTAKTILISNEKGLAKVISNEDEFHKLESLSSTTNDFNTNYVFTLEPLCYRTSVPLELVTKMKLKGERKC